MVQPADADPVTRLRALLSEGRYREVLELYPGSPARVTPLAPAIALAVATAATRLGSLEEGESLATNALGRFRQRADDDGRMRCLNLLGAIAYERGRFEEASKAFAASLELSRSLQDLQCWARASNNLASVALQQGRLEEAASLYREVMLAYQRLGDRRGLAEASHNLGVGCRELGQLPEAERLGEQAVRHAQLTGDPALIALAMTGKAEAAIAAGALEVAQEDLDRAEELAVQAGDEIAVGEVNRVRAVRWLGLGDPERALDAARLGRATAERFGSTQIQGECAAIASRAARLLGRTAESAGFLAEAEQLFRSLGAILHLARLQEEDRSQ